MSYYRRIGVYNMVKLYYNWLVVSNMSYVPSANTGMMIPNVARICRRSPTTWKLSLGHIRPAQNQLGSSSSLLGSKIWLRHSSVFQSVFHLSHLSPVLSGKGKQLMWIQHHGNGKSASMCFLHHVFFAWIIIDIQIYMRNHGYQRNVLFSSISRFLERSHLFQVFLGFAIRMVIEDHRVETKILQGGSCNPKDLVV